METVYEFSAYNTEKVYGFGTESDAQTYLNHLNADREINQYEMSPSDLTDEQAELLCFNLMDTLAELESL